MTKMHIKAALAEGYIIDECCNPPIAYRGPRFQPTVHHQCYTVLESELMEKQVHFDEVMTFLVGALHSTDESMVAKAKELVAKLPGDLLVKAPISAVR